MLSSKGTATTRRGDKPRALALVDEAVIEAQRCGPRKPKRCDSSDCVTRTSRQRTRTETACQRARGTPGDKDPEGGSAVTAGDYPTKPPPPSGLGIPLDLTRHQEETSARLRHSALAA
jgi:hypothetical protein